MQAPQPPPPPIPNPVILPNTEGQTCESDAQVPHTTNPPA